jgi:hypothetical protein
MPRPSSLLLRGSLIELSRRCGKAACHCADADPHKTHALSYSVGGSTKILTLRPSDLSEVRRALRRYRQELDKLEAQALAGIATLRKRIEEDKAARRQSRRP